MTTTIKQSDIAEQAKISSSFYCDILHERRVPRSDVAERLEAATDVELRAWLMPDKYFNRLIAEKMKDEYSFAKNKETVTSGEDDSKPQ